MFESFQRRSTMTTNNTNLCNCGSLLLRPTKRNGEVKTYAIGFPYFLVVRQFD